MRDIKARQKLGSFIKRSVIGLLVNSQGLRLLLQKASIEMKQ